MEKIAKTVLYCEILPAAQAVLQTRMDEGNLAKGIILDDVKKIDVEQINSLGCELITAGFPCPDLSAAGLGKGFGGSRSSLFRQIIRISEASCVKILLLENVYGLLSSKQVDEVLFRLSIHRRGGGEGGSS